MQSRAAYDTFPLVAQRGQGAQRSAKRTFQPAQYHLGLIAAWAIRHCATNRGQERGGASCFFLPLRPTPGTSVLPCRLRFLLTGEFPHGDSVLIFSHRPTLWTYAGLVNAGNRPRLASTISTPYTGSSPPRSIPATHSAPLAAWHPAHSIARLSEAVRSQPRVGVCPRECETLPVPVPLAPCVCWAACVASPHSAASAALALRGSVRVAAYS